MKKIVVFFVIFVMSVCGLAAQTSSRDFYVNQQNTGYMGNYSTCAEFVDATNTLVESQRQNLQNMFRGLGISTRAIWVQEPTRMENELVNRAYQELPDTTRIGSAYGIQFFSYYGDAGRMIFNVYIYSDPDGKRYHWLLRIQW